jgi:hypothetical protein
VTVFHLIIIIIIIIIIITIYLARKHPCSLHILPIAKMTVFSFCPLNAQYTLTPLNTTSFMQFNDSLIEYAVLLCDKQLIPFHRFDTIIPNKSYMSVSIFADIWWCCPKYLRSSFGFR